MTKRSFALAAVVLLAGCSIDKQAVPSLAGPSELGLSLAISATPDVITQDGKSQALIEVVARDASSQPVRGLTLRAETTVNGTVSDFGVLSSRTVSTGNDGRATLVYLAPAPPPAVASTDNMVGVRLTPVGTNYGNSYVREVEIRLARPVNQPNTAPTPRFFFTPTQPKENEDVLFDGTQSTDVDGGIATYRWDFGDGGSGTGARASHKYALAGTYNAFLTVTDDRGVSASSATQPVTVGAAVNPTAAFTFSPTTQQRGSIVFFNAVTSTVPTGRTIESYAWNFGDGAVGAGMTAQHVFGAAGTYTITLTVTDNTGRTSSVAATITITL